VLKWLDRLALAGIAAGILCVLQPWWQAGFRAGFLITAFATVGHIVTSHIHKGPAA